MHDLRIRSKEGFEVIAGCDSKAENVAKRANQCEELLCLYLTIYTDHKELLNTEIVDCAFHHQYPHARSITLINRAVQKRYPTKNQR